MKEIFLFERELHSGNHTHTVIVSEMMQPDTSVVYNCIVDIHTNIQVIYEHRQWIEKDRGVTTFSTLIGAAIATFINRGVNF